MSGKTWSDIIREQGDRRLAEAQRRLPEEIAKLPTLRDTELVGLFRQWATFGFADPRMVVEMQKMANAAEKEILRRLGEK